MDAVEEGRNYIDQGNLDETIASFNKALELNPTHIPAYIGKGMALNAQGKCHESLFKANEALRISPTIEEINPDSGFSIYIGKALNHQCIGDYNDAQIIIGDADTDKIFEFYSKGLSLRKQGQYEEAIKWFDKVLDIDPNDRFTLYNKGLSLNNLGQYEEAIKWFDKVLDIDPNHVKALREKALALDKLDK